MPSELKTAEFYQSRPEKRVICGLCPHRCALAPGEIGVCRTRRNDDGGLVVLTYGDLAAGNDDPIEKKPLFHYRPGSRTFSIASVGCNLVCPFCQNHSLSCGPVSSRGGRTVSPASVVDAAAETGCGSIAFTYSEPILMLEYATAVAPLAEAKGIELVFVTNGQAARQAAAHLSGIIHAANVDLKCFSKEKYRDVLGGRLDATLRSIEQWAAAGVWLEVTTLVIPGFNDSDAELTEIARFISGIDSRIPWHVSRFHPTHKWRDRTATPPATLARAREIGVAEGLKFVYTGNMPGDDGEKTRCPGCNRIAIDRFGYRIINVAIEAACCIACGEQIAGRGLP